MELQNASVQTRKNLFGLDLKEHLPSAIAVNCPSEPSLLNPKSQIFVFIRIDDDATQGDVVYSESDRTKVVAAMQADGKSIIE